MTFGEQPAYLRVAGDLRKKIADGLLPPHTRLPSQARIREEYGVSDTVALEARKVLMAEGLVEGRSGSGTYVREASGAVAERLGIKPGDRVMCTRYVFREAGEAVMLSTSWEPLDLTGRTPVMLPEEGPLGGMGVVERMAAIDVVVDNVTEEVGARPGLAEELLALGGVPGHVVLVVQRTFYASGRAVETADVVVPADRYRVAYHLPVR